MVRQSMAQEMYMWLILNWIKSRSSIQMAISWRSGELKVLTMGSSIGHLVWR